MAITIDGTTGITSPALDSEGNLEYSGTLTGGTGVINIGSGQVYKDASGNVGIGTTDPTGFVAGVSTKLALSQAATTYLTTFNTNNNLESNFGSSGSGTVVANRSAQPILFLTNSTEAGRFDSSRNFLVGTTSNPPASGLVLQGSGRMNIGQGSGSDRTMIAFYNGGTQVGRISTSTTATTYATTSDYRLKENLVPIPDALTRVSAIPVYRFNFIVEPETTVDGFVAHELAAHVPEAVTGEKDEVDEDGNPVHQGVDQSKVVPLLTAAVQELLEEVNALKARIEQLEQA